MTLLPEPIYHDGAFIYGKPNSNLSICVIGTMLVDVAKAILSNPEANRKFQNGEINLVSFAKLKPFPSLVKVSHYLGNKILFFGEISSACGFEAKIYQEISKSKTQYLEFHSVTAPDKFAKEVGSQDFLRSKFLLDTESVLQKLQSLY